MDYYTEVAKFSNLLNLLIEDEMEDNPNFKSWFSGSKVVDKNGKPLPVFRGFRKVPKMDKHGTLSGRATPSYTAIPEIASAYAKTPHFFGGGAKLKKHANVGKYYINMRKPLDLSDHGSATINLGDLLNEFNWTFYPNQQGKDKFGTEDALKTIEGLMHRYNKEPFEFESTASFGGMWGGVDDPEELYKELENVIDDTEYSDLSDQEIGDKLGELIDYAFHSTDVDAYALADSKNFTQIVKRLGYDGIIHLDVGEGLIKNAGVDISNLKGVNVDDSHSFVTYRPFDIKQVKSAFNKGTFDPNSKNVSEDEFE